MGEKKAEIPEQYELASKWDACLDLAVRRVVYHSLTGAFAGLLLFRSPVTRWSSVAFGAGVGIGAAYTECSYKFGSPIWKETAQEVPASSLQALVTASDVLVEAANSKHLIPLLSQSLLPTIFASIRFWICVACRPPVARKSFSASQKNARMDR